MNLPGLRELQDLVLGALAQARAAGRRNPDVALVVDVDRVLVLRPLVAGRLAAPALDVVAGGVELHHRRRRRAARRLGILRLLVVVQRPRPLDDPHVIARVHVEAGHLAENPLRRHLRPQSDRPGTPAPCAARRAVRSMARSAPASPTSTATKTTLSTSDSSNASARLLYILLHYTLPADRIDLLPRHEACCAY